MEGDRAPLPLNVAKAASAPDTAALISPAPSKLASITNAPVMSPDASPLPETLASARIAPPIPAVSVENPLKVAAALNAPSGLAVKAPVPLRRAKAPKAPTTAEFKSPEPLRPALTNARPIALAVMPPAPTTLACSGMVPPNCQDVELVPVRVADATMTYSTLACAISPLPVTVDCAPSPPAKFSAVIPPAPRVPVVQERPPDLRETPHEKGGRQPLGSELKARSGTLRNPRAAPDFPQLARVSDTLEPDKARPGFLFKTEWLPRSMMSYAQA